MGVFGDMVTEMVLDPDLVWAGAVLLFGGGASLPTEKEFLEQQRDLLKARLEEIAEELDEL